MEPKTDPTQTTDSTSALYPEWLDYHPRSVHPCASSDCINPVRSGYYRCDTHIQALLARLPNPAK